MAPLEELWLVRHGESMGNVAATRAEVEGQETIPLEWRDADVPLSDTGVEQAQALSARLRAADPAPQVAWVSPYVRAQQTFALGTADGPAIPAVFADDRLRDRELGILDLLTRKGVAARHPEEAERRAHLGKYYHRPPGGESWADVALRLRSFLRDAFDSPATVGLIVAHDAVVMLLIAIFGAWMRPSCSDSRRRTRCSTHRSPDCGAMAGNGRSRSSRTSTISSARALT